MNESAETVKSSNQSEFLISLRVRVRDMLAFFDTKTLESYTRR